MTELRLAIENRPAEYEPARERLLEHFRAAGVPEDAVAEIELMLEELLVNIISYAYQEEGAGTIDVTASARDGVARLQFCDGGRPFNVLECEAPDLDAPIADRPIGGLGIVLVKELATSVTYERVGARNVLTVTRAF